MEAPKKTAIIVKAHAYALAVFILLFTWSGCAPAASSPGLGERIAEAWVALQNPDGTFRDYVLIQRGGGRSRYGHAVLGLGLVQQGLGSDQMHLWQAGLRAIGWTLSFYDRWSKPSVFEHLALAHAYRLAESKLEDDPIYRGLRDSWQDRLRKIPIVWISGKRPYFNKYLVDAVALLELLRTGLSSGKRGAALAAPEAAKSMVLRLINQQLVRFAARNRHLAAGLPILVLSDPPSNPLAYHGLSVGFLARAIELLGDEASPQARRVLGEALNASWVLSGPDADLAYFGRSSEQSWALALTAYAAAIASRQEELPEGWRQRYRVLMHRSLQRLTGYPVVGWGQWIIPALADHPRHGIRALDSYASMIPYNGLTLMALQWLQPHLGQARPGALASERRAGWTIRAGISSFGVLGNGRYWTAIKRASSTRGDRRYDFGPHVLKRRRGNRWVDLLPLRPYAIRDNHHLGPVLRWRGRHGYAYGTRMKVQGMSMQITGGFRTYNGRWFARRRFQYRLERCGLALSFPLRRGERLAYGEILSGRVRRTRGGAQDRYLRLTINHPVKVKLGRRLASANRASTRRVDFYLTAQRNLRLRLLYRERRC